jgi:hypothetical protein
MSNIARLGLLRAMNVNIQSFRDFMLSRLVNFFVVLEDQIALVFMFKQFKTEVEVPRSSEMLVTIYQSERRNLELKMKYKI